MQFVIHDSSVGGPAIFIQRDTVIPNLIGLINVVLGGGTVTAGNFDSINWSFGTKFLEVDMDVTGGTNYIIMGTSQMLSVPYALYAQTAGSSQADTIWAKNGNNIYNTNNGNVGILTDTPQAALTVNGYTMLGIDAPPLKMQEFTGNMPTSAGDSTSFNTWIPDAKIRGASVLVQDPVNGLLSPVLNLLGLEYTYTIKASVFTLRTTLLNSLSILGKPYTVVITYRQ
jgi:hypothetical protein